MDIHESEEQYVFIHNAHQEKKCEFETTLSDTLNLTEYECALVDLNLPNNLKIDKFFVERSIYFHLEWVKKIDYDLFVKDEEPENFDTETNQNFVSTVIELKIGPNIKNLDELRSAIAEATSWDKLQSNIERFYKSRFANAILEKGENLFYPEILFDNGFFRNKIGEIRFTGLPITEVPSNIPQPVDTDNLGKLYLSKTAEFFKTRAAFIFFTFDEELHQIMGYDYNVYPNIRIIEEDNQTKYIQTNSGWAQNKCEIDWFNLIYIYTNIVRESYCGNVKANILKVFARKSDQQKDIIHYQFPNLLFVPLRVNEIRTIKIKICDNFGQVPTYSKGMISMTLLLRPKRNEF